MLIGRRVVISGLVQGVFFRDECCRAAARLGVAGWVRNRRDGRVEGHFEGEEPAVEALVGWCRQGPPRARVDDVETAEVSPEGLTGFSVQPTA